MTSSVELVATSEAATVCRSETRMRSGSIGISGSPCVSEMFLYMLSASDCAGGKRGGEGRDEGAKE